MRGQLYGAYAENNAPPSVTTGTSGPCSDLSINPTTHTSPAAGDSSSTMVTMTDQSCMWTATSNDAWITTSASGTGNGTANYTVSANSGSLRIGSLSIEGHPLAVTQDAAAAQTIGTTVSGAVVVSGGVVLR
jgi:hypothetical protein